MKSQPSGGSDWPTRRSFIATRPFPPWPAAISGVPRIRRTGIASRCGWTVSGPLINTRPSCSWIPSRPCQAHRSPESSASRPSRVSPSASGLLAEGRIVFEDFFRNEADGRIYLRILVPVFETARGNRLSAIIALLIDPEHYLYPYISRWPTPSATAETLLVRRDGQDALFLNELRFRKDSALRLRIPLRDVAVPAVRAAPRARRDRGRPGLPRVAGDRSRPGRAGISLVFGGPHRQGGDFRTLVETPPGDRFLDRGAALRRGRGVGVYLAAQTPATSGISIMPRKPCGRASPGFRPSRNRPKTRS